MKNRREYKYLDDEFDLIWARILRGDNLALLRYGDGERAIMCSQNIKANEGWEHPAHETNLSRRLLQTLNHDEEDVYYGISCPCCDREAYYWYSTRINSANITFANLLVNSNYSKLISSIGELKRDAVFIGNYRIGDKPIANFNILNRYFVSDDCIAFCDDGLDQLIEQIKDDFGNSKDLLYIVAAGPLSEIIISELFKHNGDNCYIDFGSSLDQYIHKTVTRDYQEENSKYSKKLCWMHNGSKDFFDVSVILNLYKRPEYLAEQIEAIRGQSLKPKEILCFHDKVANGPEVHAQDWLESKVDRIHTASENEGVWGRFRFGKTAKSKYLCVFDDDTIPGHRWLENCHSNMLEQEGIYGTVGVVCRKAEHYPSKMIRIGWPSQNRKRTKVDFVGHSWFFKSDWLGDMLSAPKSVTDLKICGEDMSLSYMLKKNRNIDTFVPPHPEKNKALFGSLPDLATQYGIDEHRLGGNQANVKKYNKAMNLLLADGWQTILMQDKFKAAQIALARLGTKLISNLKKRKLLRNKFYNRILR